MCNVIYVYSTECMPDSVRLQEVEDFWKVATKKHVALYLLKYSWVLECMFFIVLNWYFEMIL